MKTGTVTIGREIISTEMLKADVREDLLLFIIVEAIRNILYSQKSDALLSFHEEQMLRQPELADNTITAEDVFTDSVSYLMNVIEVNDPAFDTEDQELYWSVHASVSEKLNQAIQNIELCNAREYLLPWQDILYNVYEEAQYPSVSGTFLGNRVVLCLSVPAVFGTMNL